MAKLSTEKIWTEWKDFRKDLGEAIHRHDLMQVNFEFELGDEFCDKDTKQMLEYLNKVKTELTNIRESLR